MTHQLYAKGLYQAGEGHMVFARRDEKFNGTSRLCMFTHGHGGDATQPKPGSNLFSHIEAATRAGKIVMSIDAGGTVPWGGTAAMTAVTNAWTWAKANLGVKTDKLAIMGWSMGGLTALNWLRRNPTLVTAMWLWCPVTDMTWAHGVAGWTSEVEAVYGTSTWANNIVGSNPIGDVASYRGLGIPVRIAHAADDSVIPQSHTSTFVAAVADAAYTFRPVATGDHVGLFNNVDPDEVRLHLAA